MKRFAAGLALCGLAYVSGCGKEVGTGSLPNAGPDPSTPPRSLTCDLNDRVRWQFVQPGPSEVLKSVDLLLVVDTSSSLKTERSRIASQIPAFVSVLPPEADYRIGVMLAHGGASPYTGRLYSTSGVATILDSKKQSLDSIRTSLSSTLSKTAVDEDEADGEAMLYSLMQGLSGSRLKNSMNQGFFRDDAVWSFVFVSDENDICYPPELFGFSAFPDYVPSYRGTERVAYERYCAPSGFTGPAAVESLVSQITALRPSRAGYALGAIAHTDPAKMVRESEDSIGHGVIELVQSQRDGVLMDLADSDYSAGLSKLGRVVEKQLHLDTIFGLSGKTFRPESLSVSVDGKNVPFQFQPEASAVQIGTSEAGGSGSVIQVEACK